MLLEFTKSLPTYACIPVRLFVMIAIDSLLSETIKKGDLRDMSPGITTLKRKIDDST
ncbi:MAG: hypothetical protein OEW62_04630 [Candidatus Bathyarchaeota archaeon]|nr:hypothetical protein [Candidatus Bathyarchaeota archaeon]MDH5747475.1 hypothetical protein [Candidatus Bathyarchaeota archaeon]